MDLVILQSLESHVLSSSEHMRAVVFKYLFQMTQPHQTQLSAFDYQSLA